MAAGAGTPAREQRGRSLRLGQRRELQRCQAGGTPFVFGPGAVCGPLRVVCASAGLGLPCAPAATLLSAAVSSGRAGAGCVFVAFRRWNWRCLGEEMSGIREPSAWWRETWGDFLVGSQRPGPSGDVAQSPDRCGQRRRCRAVARCWCSRACDETLHSMSALSRYSRGSPPAMAASFPRPGCCHWGQSLGCLCRKNNLCSTHLLKENLSEVFLLTFVWFWFLHLLFHFFSFFFCLLRNSVYSKSSLKITPPMPFSLVPWQLLPHGSRPSSASCFW